MTKPPYRVPSMAEVRAVPWNGFNAISTFSGCGGSSLGYRMAGLRMLWASEFIPAAADTYRANASEHTVLDTRDIRQVTAKDILDTVNLKAGEIDLMDGSPPCAAFSTSGKREAGWGVVKTYSDTRQRVDDLFFEFTRLLGDLQPRTFVAENVAGLVQGTAKGYFKEILAALRRPGYRVSAKLLDAQWLGVPQRRHRLIFVGVREDLAMVPAHPKPLTYRYTVRDAVGDLPGAFDDLQNDPETGQPLTLRGYSVEKLWHELRPGEGHKLRTSLKRLSWDQPCATIVARAGTAGTAAITHPDHPRYPTLAELRRLGGFPDDFVLTGNYYRRWERIGRAVPPVMMARIAETVRDELLVPLRDAGRI
ncbi:restriction endonuclease subunit M [Nonomuraea cavernae]|uniref:DNA (cytosine-5-)-methyltransferase n=2 Tax=Nonomuraea cavernae TaxID=2045107 RepID=A0A917YQL4_9ACTN|nr:restriction endonuclease subunit M [Nonomuraea cavernae]